jgi:hypothetical protein
MRFGQADHFTERGLDIGLKTYLLGMGWYVRFNVVIETATLFNLALSRERMPPTLLEST